MSAQRLIRYYQDATPEQRRDGEQWYALALQQAVTFSLAHGIPVRNCAAVIAILSPQHTWAQNIRLAEECLGGRTPKCFKKMAATACAARDIGHPDYMRLGPKVRAFYRAIMGDLESVVVDRWMLRAMGDDRKSLSPKQYADAAQTIARAAFECDVRPAVFQAVVWCSIRGKSF